MIYDHSSKSGDLVSIKDWVFDQGKEGWELVSVVATEYNYNYPTGYTAFMKRAVPSNITVYKT